MPFSVDTNVTPLVLFSPYSQRSRVPAVPTLALTPTTLKIQLHRERASTTWVYLSVSHGIGFD